MIKSPDHDSEPSNPDVAIHRELAISAVHNKMEKAAASDRALQAADVDGSRRFLPRGDEFDLLVPVDHVRFGLQPELRNAPIANVQRLVLRVPMRPPHTVPQRLRDVQMNRLELGHNPVERANVPTYDIFGQIIHMNGQSSLFLLTHEGLRAYQTGEDIIEAPFQEIESGQFYDVQASLENTIVQQELDKVFNISDLAEIADKYELFQQGNIAGRASDVA